jgi:crotonobetainyl-CoA:carnitine CoA-transferase CaiB-like acyl-CoA transferase
MLDDLVVLELASVLAGPSVGQFFAELGAAVVKVENPRTGGDATRRWRLPGEVADGEAAGDDRSAYFCCCNHGKQSVALDLSTADGRGLLHELAAGADVVLASYRPGTASALGADPETLRSVNDSLLYGRITGYGPGDERPSYDAIIQAEAGFTHMNGPADGPPTKLPVALMDLLAAHQLKEGLLLGLLKRERTGKGGVVDVSLFRSAVGALANQATNWLVGGHVPERMGSAHPNIAPYGTVYPTADGTDIVLAVGTDRQFVQLCEALRLEDLPDNPNFATNAARVEHRDVLQRVLTARLSKMDGADVLEVLAARNVPAGPVRTMPEVFDTPAGEAMALRPDDGPAGLREVAFDGLDLPDGPLSPPPHYAEHTAEVLRDRLGQSDADVEALADAGTVEVKRDA